jgi:hypothetical protein
MLPPVFWREIPQGFLQCVSKPRTLDLTEKKQMKDRAFVDYFRPQITQIAQIFSNITL